MSEVSKRVDSMDVFAFIQRQGLASTKQVSQKFKIRPEQAAANIAILRIKGLLDNQGKGTGRDTSSLWSAKD